MSEILIVFETDKDEKEYILNNKIYDCIHTASILRGAGSIHLKRDVTFDTVTFIRKDYCGGNYCDYALYLDKFIRELNNYKLVTKETKYV
ncbi:hypothetical protein KDN24_07020 [Bacillus sp. Bva_UNVM-123]|uniref:hypothetical protein n=1 Tax=Bacillus sp. Bva_UNVM-123 TaxID=2829798 RepID=UPI00391F0CBA